MYEKIQRQFGTAGLILSIVALVAAFSGGAYAATAHSSKAKAGKRGPRGPKGAPGATGPAGPAGPQGPAGTNGTNGTNGTDGTDGTDGSNGTNGKSVLNGSGAPTAGVGTIGDFYIDTDSDTLYGPKAATGDNGGYGDGVSLIGQDGQDGHSVTGAPISAGGACGTGTTGVAYTLNATETDVCNGSPWTAGGTLPSGATETGMWSYDAVLPQENTVHAPISFSVPTKGRISNANIIYVTIANNPDPTNCPGTVSSPQATSGHLCVYANNEDDGNLGAPIFSNPNPGSGNPDAGVVMLHFPTLTTTGDLDGSTTVANVADTSIFQTGDSISDVTTPANIPDGTTVTAIDSVNSTITLSNAATATATGDTLRMDSSRYDSNQGSYAVTAP